MCQAGSFLNRRVIPESLKTMDRLLVYIFCIRIMLADVDIFVMQVMQLVQSAEGSILERSW